MENRIAIFRMPRAGDFGELLDDVIALAQEKLRQDLVMQALKKLSISSDVPAVEQRNCEFHILRIELLAFRQRAGRGTNLHAQIPQFLAKSPDRITQAL